MQVTFSDYAEHPGKTRESKYPQFGMPSYKIEGCRPKRMTLTGCDPMAEYTDEELNDINVWFFQKCYAGLYPIGPTVIIACDLPAQLQQWNRVSKQEEDTSADV